MSFINCRIVGENVAHSQYAKQPDGVLRGDPKYVMSRGELIEFALCPEKWVNQPEEDDDTAASDWGSLIDCLITAPDRFESLFILCPATYINSKKQVADWTMKSKTCREWVDDKRAKGLTVLTAEVKSNADAAVNVIRQRPELVELIRVSKKQVHVIAIWKDKKTGLEIPVQILLDLVPPADHPKFGKWLSDIKTARNGDPSNWARVVDDCGYDVQAALYRDVYCAATGEDRTDWLWAVQENIPPFHVVHPMMAATSEFMQYGRIKYQSALAYYAECLSGGKWPSYRMAGMPYPPGNPIMQLIGPEELWTYRKTAGQGSLGASEPYHSEPDKPQKQDDDLIP